MARIHQVRAARVRRNRDGSLKPSEHCELDGTEIRPGDSYQWVSIKTSAYTSQRRVRCATCPRWQPYELSTALWAQLEAIAAALTQAVEQANNADDVDDALHEAITQIRELAEEKRDASSNIEDGFGHATTQSDELAETADQLDDWAQDLEDIELPELPDDDDEPSAAEFAQWCEAVAALLEPVLDNIPG